MFLTVTLNPSVDVSYPLKTLKIDSINRVSEVRKEAGGKGLNVTRVIKQAGEEVLATGLLGGILGNYILEQLDGMHIKHRFQGIVQDTRNCIAILHEGYQTEILESGPVISQKEQDQFITLFDELLESAKIITISGSLPPGISSDYYQRLILLAHKKNKKVLLDCSGDSLNIAINGAKLPYLIKPNKEELENLTGKKLDVKKIKSFIDIVNSNIQLQAIPWVVVSLGKYGAFAKINDCFFTIVIPEIDVVNPVGSGDSTIAGLAISISNNDPIEITLKKAMAFGMLNAMEKQTGAININKLEELLSLIIIYPEL